MKRNTKHIDDFFKEELGSYAEAPPQFAWETLEKKLDGRKAGPRPPYRRLGYFAILSLFLLLSVTVARRVSSNSQGGDSGTASNTDTRSELSAAGTSKGNSQSNETSAPASQSSAVGEEKSNNSGTNSAPSPGASHEQNSDDNKNKGNAGKRTRLYAQAAAQQKGARNKNRETAANTEEKSYSGNLNKTGNSAAPFAVSEEPTGSTPAAMSNSIKNAGTVKDQKKEQLAKNNVAANQPGQQDKPKTRRFEAGIKGGLETGFNSDAARKIVGSPYIQYNISRKFALMLQPGVKYAQLAARQIGSAQSYYKVNNDGAATVIGASNPVIGDGYVIGYITPAHYSQSHDSIVKTNSIGGNYMEYDLPVLLNYRLSKNFSVYGGPNVAVSKKISISENTWKTTLKIDDTPNVFSPQPLTAQSDPTTYLPMSSVIAYNNNGQPISSYKGPLYPTHTGYAVRMGYMVGFSYEFVDKWLFDMLVQQTNMNRNVQAGYNVNSSMSAPYIRLTLGYKLTGK